ncbi:mycothiol system anti-sigma-R factor [Nocardioides insulae]|uniref:mycothiol system anti-sigma-R factor n=1 Tax=Nocardioides insulae TaxID=394734 RepID=UPI0003FF54F3|nr:mycothiol system anti-sigma-R factor [Nocardioides insulae]
MSTDPFDDISARECADFLDQIVYLLDNELADAECAEVRAHLDTCHPCLERYDVQRTVKAVIARSCSEPAPAELRDRVRFRLQQVRIQITEA